MFDARTAADQPQIHPRRMHVTWKFLGKNLLQTPACQVLETRASPWIEQLFVMQGTHFLCGRNPKDRLDSASGLYHCFSIREHLNLPGCHFWLKTHDNLGVYDQHFAVVRDVSHRFHSLNYIFHYVRTIRLSAQKENSIISKRAPGHMFT